MSAASLSNTHTAIHTQAPKFLLYRTDLWITLLSSSYGTTSKGLIPFELTAYYRHTHRGGKEAFILFFF